VTIPNGCVAGICRERVSGRPAESHEDCPVRLLVMRQAAVVVVVGQRRRFRHRLFKPRALVAVYDGWTIDLVAGLVWSWSCVEQTLLSAAFDSDFDFLPLLRTLLINNRFQRKDRTEAHRETALHPP